jgi:hypothetical protein
MRTNHEHHWRAGRPWLEREPGECAYPIRGEGVELISCAQAAKRGGYCAAHRRAMFRAADPEEARELGRLIKSLEREGAR